MRNINEIMEDVEKRNIIYNGFDQSECADSFLIKTTSDSTTLILINPYGIHFNTRTTNYMDLEKSKPTFIMYDYFDLIIEIYQYIKTTNQSIPKCYAKRQKDLDDYFEFENGNSDIELL